MKMQMFLKTKNHLRKWVLRKMDKEPDMAKALGLGTVLTMITIIIIWGQSDFRAYQNTRRI